MGLIYIDGLELLSDLCGQRADLLRRLLLHQSAPLAAEILAEALALPRLLARQAVYQGVLQKDRRVSQDLVQDARRQDEDSSVRVL